MNDEEYVRAKWVNLEIIESMDRRTLISAGGVTTILAAQKMTLSEMWEHAKAFTEDRERQIAEVEEEIAVEQGCIESCETLSEIPEAQRHLAAHKRILAFERERLAALQAGMREVK
jgi:hypothetical protein